MTTIEKLVRDACDSVSENPRHKCASDLGVECDQCYAEMRAVNACQHEVNAALGPEVLSWDPEAVRELIAAARETMASLYRLRAEFGVPPTDPPAKRSHVNRLRAALHAVVYKPKRWRCKECGAEVEPTICGTGGWAHFRGKVECGPVEQVRDGEAS